MHRSMGRSYENTNNGRTGPYIDVDTLLSFAFAFTTHDESYTTFHV